MNEKAPARKQRLNLDTRKSDSSTKLTNSHYRQQVLDELARKRTRYGGADTTNEALEMLLGGGR